MTTRFVGRTEWWIAANFVPRLLNDDQKQHRLEVITELKEYARNGSYFLSKFVTVNENWIYVHDPKLKQLSSKWNCSSTSAEESAASEEQYEVNADLHFYNDKIVRKEFVLPGQTVNAMFYCYPLRRLKGEMTRKPPDNAPASTALAMQQFCPPKRDGFNTGI
jgi:hypothetical protein